MEIRSVEKVDFFLLGTLNRCEYRGRIFGYPINILQQAFSFARSTSSPPINFRLGHVTRDKENIFKKLT